MPSRASVKSSNNLSLAVAQKETQEVCIGPIAKLAWKGLDSSAPFAAVKLSGRAPVVLIDKRVQTLWADAIKASPLFKEAAEKNQMLFLPIGEASKTLPTVETTLRSLARMGVTRNDNFVVAVGGGALLDSAGFIASVYHRGLPLVHVPTTLLAMVDATLGGKTSVNFLGNKNQVGSFYLPALSIIDPEFLETLSPDHLRNGLIETVKMAFLVGTKELDAVSELIADVLAGDKDAAEHIIQQGLRIKSKYISEDMYEDMSDGKTDKTKRCHLNLGHTTGHAMEAIYGGRITHGDAVGSGMLVAAEVARELGMLGKGTDTALTSALAACGFMLPQVQDPAHLAHLLWGSIGTDKKVKGGRVVFVLPLAPGKVEMAPVGMETFTAAALRVFGN
jgi:3-dehydroquinate synthase